jgi:hypothetical protein
MYRRQTSGRDALGLVVGRVERGSQSTAMPFLPVERRIGPVRAARDLNARQPQPSGCEAGRHAIENFCQKPTEATPFSPSVCLASAGVAIS